MGGTNAGVTSTMATLWNDILNSFTITYNGQTFTADKVLIVDNSVYGNANAMVRHHFIVHMS